jgi:FMN phosphatase YigB (HAD superfamily)
MKVILFDLGNTLEDTQREVLLPGALKTLNATRAMRDSEGHAPVLALVSDFGETSATPEQILASQNEYYAILDRHKIRRFFEPVAHIRAGLPAVLAIEGADNTNHNIHSARDILNNIDFDFCLEILRAVTGFVTGTLDRAG